MKERIEALAQILQDLGIEISIENIEQITKDFSHHIDMEREMETYAHIGYKEKCSKCEKFQSEINALKKEISCYKDSVKRRNNASEVWIGNYGEVRFEK